MRPSAATTSSVATPSSARAAHRKLSDYCGIFAEKTNRIGRNVESFMQSRGLLPTRRSFDETSRADLPNSNGDVVRNDRSRGECATRENHRGRLSHRRESHDYQKLPRSSRTKRVACPNAAYPRESRGNGSNYVDRSHGTAPRRSRRREYVADYDDEDDWRRDAAASGPTVFKPILRNGINHGRDERPYYSTLPRRSRTINFKDQARGLNSLESGRGRAYPKSLQDLTDLELDDVTYLPSSRERLDDYRRRAADQRENELAFDDDYLRLCRNLSRLDGYPRGGRYEPGQVHYERECRTFGKDTVAFIYYKTCYL